MYRLFQQITSCVPLTTSARRSLARGSCVEALEARIAPATLFGLDDSNHLIRFDSATPGVTSAPITITGLAPGEQLEGIDFRPATGQLYVLAIIEGPSVDDTTGRIYTVNTASGVATPVGAAPFSTTLAHGAEYGFDFNPTVDRIRIVNSADQNLRVNPDTGALAASDTALDDAAGTEEIVGAAYDRSGGGPASTTLYGIDAANNRLVFQGGADGNPSPNLGNISSAGPLGVTLATPDVGFDIAQGTGTAFATFKVGASTGLYSINLTTGAATLVGNVGTGAIPIVGLAAATSAIVVAGTAGSDSLVVTATGPDSGSYSLNGGAAVPFTGITAFTFDAGAGADTLTINNPTGSVFAPSGGISFNGQDPTVSPGDALVLAGGGGAGFGESYSAAGVAGAGTIATGNGTLTQTITFSGVEATITDTVTAAMLEIHLTAAADVTSVTTGPLVGVAQTTTIGDGVAGNYDDISFANKAAVRVNGLGGADAFTVSQTAAGTGLTSLALFGHSATAGGDDNAVESFVITTATSATSLNGGGGNDHFTFGNGATLNGGTIDGGAGEGDLLDYSAYTTGVAVNLGSAPGTLVATLSPDQEVPPNATAASGTATLNYNAATKTFDITLNVTGIAPADVSGFHIHNAAFGVNGSIFIDFAPGGTPIAPLVATATGFTFSANNIAVPALKEAALLGGVSYLNVHTTPSFTGGQIRGQLFAGANFVATGGTATGTGGVSGVENALTGSGDDSLVGSLAANSITAGPGNDTIVGSGGADLLVGREGNDVIAWNNGDGTDVVDGGADTDTVQVNSGISADDEFTIGADTFGHIDFDRISPGPFGLDIAATESLVVNGLGGNDTFRVNNLGTVSDLANLNLNGLDGNDTFNIGLASGVSFPTAIALNINGGAPRADAANRDVVNLDVDGARNVTISYGTGATGGVVVTGLGSPININAGERVNYLGDAGNDDAVSIVGTDSADFFTLRPTSASSAEVFHGGTATATPGVAGGSLNPDLVLTGLGSTLQIAAGAPSGTVPGDRLAYLGNGSLTAPGTGSGTIENRSGFIPVQFSGIETLTGLTPVLNGGDEAFSSPTGYAVGIAPRAIATGDVNKDGFIDMVVANTSSNTISILLGTGDGTFLPATTRGSGGVKPVALALQDFTGDGNLDIAIVNRASNAVNILAGSGSGTFSAGAVITVAEGANAIEAGHLDNDQDIDIAVTSATSNRVNILLNDGTGSFGTATQLPPRGKLPRDLAIGDFNADGNADLAIANSGSNTVGLLLGSANGVFTPTSRFTVGERPTSIAVADFNADGKLDLAASHTVSRFVSVLLGNGAGTGPQFGRQLHILYGTTVAPASIATADFNSDGIADLILAGGKRSAFTITLGLGNGTFATSTNFPLLNFPASNSVALALADFDGSGSLDVALGNVTSNDVTVSLRTIV